jgi:hypothetical protein
MIGFTGLSSNFYTGVVEDRHDPLYLGRVRVRVYGLHTDDKLLIPTPDLPWSDILMPTTSPSLSGLGLSPHGLVEGSTVMGFFRDEKICKILSLWVVFLDDQTTLIRYRTMM